MYDETVMGSGGLFLGAIIELTFEYPDSEITVTATGAGVDTIVLVNGSAIDNVNATANGASCGPTSIEIWESVAPTTPLPLRTVMNPALVGVETTRSRVSATSNTVICFIRLRTPRPRLRAGRT